VWNVKANVIPEITGRLEPSKNHSEYLSNIPGKHEIKELHKPTILCTAHKLREMMM